MYDISTRIPCLQDRMCFLDKGSTLWIILVQRYDYMIFQTHVADVYNRGCSFWIRRSTHSPPLPLDGSSHNLSQSKIKICWKTEKTQFTAQAHANPQNTVCVFRLSLKSEKYKYLDIQNISLTQVPQLKSPCCTIQTSWSTHY